MMTRCEAFYRKFDRDGNFCGLDEKTVYQVKAYITEKKKINEIAAKSAIADISISEGACRALVTRQNAKIHDQILVKILELASSKIAAGEEPEITGNEVQGIIDVLRPPKPTVVPEPEPVMEEVQVHEVVPEPTEPPAPLTPSDLVNALVADIRDGLRSGITLASIKQAFDSLIEGSLEDEVVSQIPEPAYVSDMEMTAIMADREAHVQKLSEKWGPEWNEHFWCGTCGAEFSVGYNTARYCPMCKSTKVATPPQITTEMGVRDESSSQHKRCHELLEARRAAALECDVIEIGKRRIEERKKAKT